MNKRPFWVWPISIFYGFSGILALLSLYRIVLAPAGIDPAQLAAVKGEALGWSLYGAIPAANLAGSILLFVMHRYAFYAFTGAFVLNLGNTGTRLALGGAAGGLNTGSSLIGVILGMGLSLAVCVYAYHLKKSDRLR